MHESLWSAVAAPAPTRRPAGLATSISCTRVDKFLVAAFSGVVPQYSKRR